MMGVTIIPRRDVGDHVRLLPPERFSPDLADCRELVPPGAPGISHSSPGRVRDGP